MKQIEMPKTSKRRFSKWVIGANIALAWGVIYVGIVTGQAEVVIAPGMTLVGSLFGIYAGVGHLDMRKAVQLSIDQIVKGNTANG